MNLCVEDGGPQSLWVFISAIDCVEVKVCGHVAVSDSLPPGADGGAMHPVVLCSAGPVEIFEGVFRKAVTVAKVGRHRKIA